MSLFAYIFSSVESASFMEAGDLSGSCLEAKMAVVSWHTSLIPHSGETESNDSLELRIFEPEWLKSQPSYSIVKFAKYFRNIIPFYPHNNYVK